MVILLTLLISTLSSEHVFSMDQKIEGKGLSTPLELDLEFGDADHILITASQDSADYVLELKQRGHEKPILKVNIPSMKGLEEYLLVDKGDCNRCYLNMYGLEEVDRSSPYQLKLERFYGDVEVEKVELLKKITSVAELRSKIHESQGERRNRLMSEFSIKLQQAASIRVSSDDRKYQLHLLTLLAETLFYVDKEAEQKQTLNYILELTHGDNSKYRAQAFYELAPLEKNVVVQRQYYNEGMSIAKEIGDRHLLAMGANYKATNLVRDGRIEEGIVSLKVASDIYSTTGRWRNLFEPLHNLSWANQRLNNFTESLSYATQQKLLAERYKNEEHAIWALYNLGRSYRGLGEWFEAEKFYEEALAIQTSIAHQKKTTLALSKAYLYQEMTQGLLEFGAFDLAADFVIKVKQEFGEQAYASRSIKVTQLEADIAMARLDYKLAEQKYLRVLDYDVENSRTRSEGETLLRLAELKMRQNEFVLAENFNSKALKIISTTDDHDLKVDAFSQTVALLHGLGASEDAAKLITQTERFVEKFASEEKRARFNYRKATVAKVLGNNRSAILALDRSIEIIEQILPKVRRRDLRQSYFALQKDVFETKISILLEQGSSSILQALKLAEAYKSRTLEEEIFSPNNLNQISAEQKAHRASIHSLIQSQATEWYGSGDAEPEKILAKARETSYELERLESKIIERQVIRGKLETNSTDSDFSVRENELVAYYFIGTHKSWLWTLTNNALDVIELPSRDEIIELVGPVKYQFSHSPIERVDIPPWKEHQALVNLSSAVLFPLKKVLDLNKIERITVIPDGPINGLPFAPLVLSENQPPLILSYPISYLPSLGARAALTQRSQAAQAGEARTVLVVADPVGKTNSRFELSALPHSKEEALAIKSIFGADAELLLSNNARKQSFLKRLSKRYSIMHFATHGLLNEQVPALSGLVFSEGATGNDVWLSSEIRNANITAGLVVLSACETSVGKRVAGEGLFSLSRAFIQGGANQVIGTLWKVEDKATSKLIGEFYSELAKESKTVSQTLQHAQSLIYQDEEHDWTDPYYWAGFQLQGSEYRLNLTAQKKVSDATKHIDSGYNEAQNVN
ncbi:MAG: CHAT domain-containing protein [Bermanella sp.]|jgi:CHAT domain-containing protein